MPNLEIKRVILEIKTSKPEIKEAYSENKWRDLVISWRLYKKTASNPSILRIEAVFKNILAT